MVETSSLRLFGKEKKEERRIGPKSALWETISLRILDLLEKIRGPLDASRRAASNDHHFGWIRKNRDVENHKKVPLSSEIDLFKIQPLISASSAALSHCSMQLCVCSFKNFQGKARIRRGTSSQKSGTTHTHTRIRTPKSGGDTLASDGPSGRADATNVKGRGEARARCLVLL